MDLADGEKKKKKRGRRIEQMSSYNLPKRVAMDWPAGKKRM